MIAVDSDGRKMLDFAGQEIRDIAENLTQQHVADALRFSSESRAEFESSGNKELSARYARLEAYLESRIDLWT
jgi:hypothetical protein